MMKSAFKKILLGILALVVLLLAVLVFNALTFSSVQQKVQLVKLKVDEQAAARRLSGALKIKTITINGQKIDPKPFTAFRAYLEKTFPEAHKVLKREIINGHALLYTWQGTDSKLEPILLMGHQDVVPIAAPKSWKHPAFSGLIKDGYIWGRGALDDKSTILALLEGVSHLAKQGFKPKRTVYLAFGHDEEIGGAEGAKQIAKTLKERKVKLQYVLDEGLAITEGILAGLKPPTALIGLAEKGYLTLKLVAKSAGGHSSMPPPHTAVGILSTAIHKLEGDPFPASLRNPVDLLFQHIGPEFGFGRKMIFSNLWLFRPILLGILSKKNSTNAMIRTTTAATMFSGSNKENILPSQASATVNFRILPGETTKSVIARVKKVIDNPKVQIKVASGSFAKDPSFVSSHTTDSYKQLVKTIQQVIPEVIVAPSLVMGGTDSRHYKDLTQSIYRFMPIRVGPKDLKRIHGINERISVKNYGECVQFYTQLLKNTAK
mgnify:CR=1 FL=1